MSGQIDIRPPEVEAPDVIGDLGAAHLRAWVAPGEDRPELRIGDEDSTAVIDAEFGSVEQVILGVERLISAAQEYRDLLLRGSL